MTAAACRAYLLCRASFAGRRMPVARATKANPGALTAIEPTLNSSPAFTVTAGTNTYNITVTADTTGDTFSTILQMSFVVGITVALPVIGYNVWAFLSPALYRNERRVVIPYAPDLAQLIPPKALRLRRDFRTVLSLIRAYAVLHQVNRARDGAGRVVASYSDRCHQS